MNLLSKLFPPKKQKDLEGSCELEKCVHCGAETTVLVSAPIESRPNFVSGCGQLCPDCFAKLCEASITDEESSKIISSALSKDKNQAR